jgi:hypothetical protein
MGRGRCQPCACRHSSNGICCFSSSIAVRFTDCLPRLTEYGRACQDPRATMVGVRRLTGQ